MTLQREQIILEAVALLDESGLEGVTLRKLADRLHVQAPTLYWHIKGKTGLINEMAEVILRQEFAGLKPISKDETWHTWLATIAKRLRRAMTAHTDGARVIASAQMSQAMADISEIVIKSLLGKGLALREARLITLTAERFVIGFVLEEQSPQVDTDALKQFDLEAFKQSHPTLTAGIQEYFGAGNTVDDLFADSLRLILR